MTTIRNILITFAGLLGMGFVVTIGGLMVDPAHAHLWTQGLMWTLLSSLILAPLFLFVDFSTTADESVQPSDAPATPPPFEPEPAPFD